jgi:hypothetical protein
MVTQDTARPSKKENISRQNIKNGHHLTSQRSFQAFLEGTKNIKFLLPADTEENITCVNLLRKAGDSSILMANNALVAICSIHLLPLAKF